MGRLDEKRESGWKLLKTMFIIEACILMFYIIGVIIAGINALSAIILLIEVATFTLLDWKFYEKKLLMLDAASQAEPVDAVLKGIAIFESGDDRKNNYEYLILPVFRTGDNRLHATAGKENGSFYMTAVKKGKPVSEETVLLYKDADALGSTDIDAIETAKIGDNALLYIINDRTQSAGVAKTGKIKAAKYYWDKCDIAGELDINDLKHISFFKGIAEIL